jgi:hypothetical protein
LTGGNERAQDEGVSNRAAPHPSALALVVILACGGDDGETSASVGEAATNPVTDSSASDATSAGSTSPMPTTTSGPAESSSDGPDPTSLDGSSDGGGSSDCDPPNAPFVLAPNLQASISFDFAAQTCAAHSQTTADPQIVLDVQDTGLIDATAFGLEITDASAGLLFEDPPMGDSQVIDLSPEFPISFTATTIPDGTPVQIDFEVFQQGPTLVDARAEFG